MTGATRRRGRGLDLGHAAALVAVLAACCLGGGLGHGGRSSSNRQPWDRDGLEPARTARTSRARATRHNGIGKQDPSTVYWTVDDDLDAAPLGSPLYPPIVNVAPHGRIAANATCGERGEERWCKGGGPGGGLGGGGRRGLQCHSCHRHHPDRAHPADLALDASSDGWWQAPTLAEGAQYEHVTVTLDLQQVYHVSYVILKTGPSPRPAAWVLERSVDDADGEVGDGAFTPWQYYAPTDEDCWGRFGVAATPGDPAKAVLQRDDQVICTSFHSKAYPAEDAAVHTWLVKGRPGANASSDSLRAFQAARKVRLRFQKLSLPHNADPRRAFYSIKFLSIGAQCACNGHASKCTSPAKGGRASCKCQHNTEGAACERCRPRFQQQPWAHGQPCEECQCHGHARACRYDADVDRRGASMDKHGVYRGGGVCLNCTGHTTGNNCERCVEGWFRPAGVAADATKPCVPCECHPEGSSGACAADDTTPGVEAGACECREGFTGFHCDRCAPGHRNFPTCEPCPCDPRGSEHAADCDGECFCKAHVEGARCDRCRPGYFGLDRRDPNGCSACFCSGITTDCTEAALALTEVNHYQGWLVSDLRVTETVTPVVDQDTGLLTVADADLDVDSYYWLAPPPYRGNLLASYGSVLTFATAWVVMRGDTSGKPTAGPDLILIGANGMRVGYGDSVHVEHNATVRVPLREGPEGHESAEPSWYLLRDGVRDISTRLRRTGSEQVESPYRGEPASRNQLLSVLADVQHVLVRAKYHRDQVDGSLEMAVLQRGEPAPDQDLLDGMAGYSRPGVMLTLVEQCACPDGYVGLSCEACAWGYARVSAQGLGSNATTGLASGHRGLCAKCNCNGHAASCDPDTNACGTCEHNTAGDRCERCADGFFGDALRGLPGDCRPCACPLLLPSNNFSPSCELQMPTDPVGDNDVLEDYVCTACPRGHAGRHCDRCAEGFFGDPTVPGDACRACECGGGPCDAATGRCLSCPGNTDGWRCEKCKAGHFGEPDKGLCRPCQCDNVGAVTTDSCDEATGQCQCKPRYTGRTCDRCEEGRGNVTAGCVACACSGKGSTSTSCDAVTGACDCKPGYLPPHCHACLQHHYDDPDTGCAGCGCHPAGSQHAACDIVTGRCECRANVVGRTCDACKHGFWGLAAGEGCAPCLCDTLGAYNESCHAATGQCPCKPGIGGRACDSCLPGYVGFSPDGCRECDPCDRPGHVCDPDTGHCVCPPLTFGEECEVCEMDSWGFRTGRGCKPCACDPAGSYLSQCDAGTGQCSCRRGFAGPRCDACAHGFYGYPNCRACRCDARGADPATCDTEGRCSCDAQGQCSCKGNAGGARCDVCKPGTFGLRAEDHDGCQACFCFGRSSLCSEKGLTWGRVTQFRPRTLSVQYESTNPQFRPGAQLFPVNTKEICYINLALPGADKSLNTTPDRLDVSNNLRIIPGDAGDVEMGVNYLFDTPIYWQLPRQFLGDRVLSFGGFLRFTVETEGGSTLFPPEVLDSYPLIQLQGNNRIVLEHFPSHSSTDGHYEVRLHHSLWRAKNNATSKVTRELLMLALQNVQHVLIRATDAIDFTKAVLRGISLDTAQAVLGHRGPPAVGVELCECPRQYSASSCQDPSIGFFRWHDKTAVHSTIVIQMIGEARPCQCNGRSEVCDVESGHCKNCSANTGGPACDRCAEGHYGHPDAPHGCRACPCPSERRNFATSCEVGAGAAGPAVCHCREGYEGAKCEHCAPGWFGQPLRPGGSCQPCLCDPLGSAADTCDDKGQCTCLPGVSGLRCSRCPARQVLTARGLCTTCDDACTGDLLRGIEDLAFDLELGAGKATGGALEAPWAVLDGIQGQAKHARARLDAWRQVAEQANDIPVSMPATMRKPANQALKEAKKVEHASVEMSGVASQLRQGVDGVFDEIEKTRKQIQDTVASLRTYAAGPSPHLPSGQQGSALADAQYVLDSIVAAMAFLEPRATHTYNNFRKCDEIHDELVKLLDFGDVQRLANVRNRVQQLQEGLRDLNETLSLSNSNASQVDQRYTNKNRRKMKELVARAAWLSAEEVSLSAMVTANAEALNSADAAVSATQVNLEGVRRQQARLSNQTATLEQRVRSESRPDLTTYFIIARDRANMLQHTADMYERLFSGTKRDAELALQASAAYRNIADALREAWAAASNASEAADSAHRKAYPKHLDSLLDQSSLAFQDSQRLEGSANEQARRVSRLRQNLEEHESVVATLRETIILAGRRNNDNHKPLQQLQQLEGQLLLERGEAQRVLDDMLDEQRLAAQQRTLAANVLHNVTAVLRPTMGGLSLDGDAAGQQGQQGLAATERQLKESHTLLVRSKETLQTLAEASAEQQHNFQRWNGTFAEQLQALKDKIARARHVADGIRLPLKSTKDSAKDPGCSRSYALPEPGPTTTTSISLFYSISGRARSAPIFYLPSTATGDFIALDMVERRVRLSWDVGGGPGSVTAPTTLVARPGLNPDDVLWYRVEAERTGNIGHLMVVEAVRPDGGPPPKVVFNATAPGFGRLDTGSVAWVGGSTEDEAHAAAVGLGGCLHSLQLDGRPIGLWNFRTSTAGCGACKQGVEQQQDDQAYHFRGDGYSELRHSSSSPYNKYFFSVSLNFRSFDEDALLFLAVKEDDPLGRYVSLSLHRGKVRFRIGYGGHEDKHLEITTAARYNSGNWTSVEASRYFDRKLNLEKGLLKVDGEVRHGSPATPLQADSLPDLASALYYIGGVPPGFRTVGPPEALVSFLGCMSMVQAAQEGYNPLRGQFYGVEPSCTDKPVRVASFGGNGYLELASHSLRKKSSFGFAFSTLQPDTMLMVSTFQRPGGPISSEVEEENTNFIESGDNSYYSCALWNGRLDVRVDAGRGTVVLQSAPGAGPLNDGLLHSVAVTKTGRRLELRVDDVLQSTASLPEGPAAVRAPGDQGGLYFGGVPATLNVSDMLATSMPLIGTIKDAIFNDELLSMGRPVSFDNAAIGRLVPMGAIALLEPPVNTSPIAPSSPSSPSSPPASTPRAQAPPLQAADPAGCRRMSSYSFESGAVKFGDAPDSHVLFTFRRQRNILQRDFAVELQFRTFYPSGMLYLVPGSGGGGGGGGGRQRQYLAAYLLDGILQVIYKGRNKLEVSLPNTYNDGVWHTVRLKKEGRTLTLSVDNDPSERRKGPKKMNIGNSVYFGGLPDNSLLAPDNFVQRLEHFRGCMRSLTVNSIPKDLVGDDATHHQVGQCFSDVELGSYFAGDAYAIYKNKFVVADLLQVEVEFRTSELTGVLLSISEQKGYPAMSLELNNGRVVLAGDIGDRRGFEVNLALPSQWTLCDNRWHRIRTSYKRGELQLQVDDLKQVHQLADDGHYIETRTNSPMFIGGLPEGIVREGLGVKDNFKGCIRKVMIGGERRDWTVMADLHNIGLGSCPVEN